MSKHFRITVAIIGTLVALAVAPIVVMSTSWFHRALEHRLIVGIEEVTGGRVEVGEFRFHPLILEAVFHGFVLHGSEPSQAPPLFSARTVVVRLNAYNLLHREIRIMSLDWDGAEVHFRTNPDGSTNLPGPMTRFNAGEIMEQLIELRIGRVTLAHSTLFWNNQALNFDLSARDVALLLRVRRGHRHEGSLTASAVTVHRQGQSMPPLTFFARFDLSPNELAVTSLGWKFPGMNGQGSFTIHPAPEFESYFSFQTSTDVANLNLLLHRRDLQSGALSIEGQGIFHHGQLSAHGRLQARQLLFRNTQFNAGPLEASADYSLDRSGVAISNLRVLGWGGRALGDGRLSLAGPAPEFHIRARLQDMNLAALLQSSKAQPLLLRQLHPASRIDGAVELNWVGRPDQIKSKFDLRLSVPVTLPPGSLPVSGDMQGSLETNHGVSVSLEGASLHTPHSFLRATGTLVESVGRSPSPGSLQIQFQTSQVEEWRPVFETLSESTQALAFSLKSSATFTGEVGGSVDSPRIRGSLKVGGFEYRGWRWDGLQANLVAQPDVVQVSSGRLVHGTSALDLEATARLENWTFRKTSLVQLSARAERTPLEGLKAALGIDYPVDGYVSGQLNVGGTTSNLAGMGTVRVESGHIAGETFDSLSTSVHILGSSWKLDSIKLVRDHGSITGKATVEAATRSVTCQLSGAGFSLADFKNLAQLFPTPSHVPPLQGEVSFEVQGSGTPESFRFRSTGLAQAISIGGTPVGDIHLQLDGEGQDLRLQGISSGPAGMFSLSGDAKAAGNWPVQLQGQYISFRLDPWARLFLNNTLSAQVVVSGSFKANGALRDLPRLDAHSEIQTLEVSFPSLKWRNEHPVEVRFASGRLSAQPFRMQGPSTNLTVEGSLDLVGPASLALTAQGIADATALSLIDPSLQAAGHARVKVSASGSPARPQLNGTIEIEEVSLDYRDLPFRLSNLNGEIQLEGDRATVKSLRGISGGGTVTLHGFVTLTSPPRLELGAELDQVRVRYPIDFTSILSGTLRWEGNWNRSELRGDLAVRQVLPSLNKDLLGQLMESSNPVEETTPSTASSLADSVKLNIRASSPTPVSLDAQGTQLTADIDVHLQGSLQNPVELGTVQFLNGQAVFRGNRFTLTRGDISFNNPIRTEATLDMEAQTRVQQYDLTVDVSGPLGRLKMTYRSDPPLPTEDVLSLLALGYARQQQLASTPGLVSSFFAGNQLQTVGESALLSQALSSQVGGRIQRLFGVSRIKIDPNVGLPGINSGARVTVEQQITRDLTLTYITNTANSQYQIIQFEWAFGENRSLLGIRDPNGIVGVELRFRHRFK
jgi:translocation and assembly module TamB